MWSSPKDGREFFEEYAKKSGFDPLVPENWYIQKKKHIMTIKVAKQKKIEKEQTKLKPRKIYSLDRRNANKSSGDLRGYTSI